MRYARTWHLECPKPIEGTESGDVEYELLNNEWNTASRPHLDQA